MKYSYIVVEGPHDIEVIGRILKLYRFKRVQEITKLEKYWLDIIPKQFPHQGNLLARVPVPTFFQSDDYSIAVHSAGGISKIANVCRLTLLNILNKDEFLSSIGVVIDADDQKADVSFNKIKPSLITAYNEFSKINHAGEILEGTPRLGVHIFPDNHNSGTLEDMLIECSKEIYPDILEYALTYIDNIDIKHKINWGLTDKPKVIVGCIANILKPGKANQVSIQDNEWISNATKEIQSVKHLDNFLKNLLNL